MDCGIARYIKRLSMCEFEGFESILGSGIEDGPEVPEVQRQHNVQRTIRLRRVGVVTGHIIAYTTR